MTDTLPHFTQAFLCDENPIVCVSRPTLNKMFLLGAGSSLQVIVKVLVKRNGGRQNYFEDIFNNIAFLSDMASVLFLMDGNYDN